MRLVPLLCLDGHEIANGRRTADYIRNIDPAGWNITDACDCESLLRVDAYDAPLDYTTPAGDNAPWYDAGRPESEEFFGMWPTLITLGNVLTREASNRSDIGAFLGPENLRGRSVSVNGYLAASSAEGMYYGERWLTEVLRGCCGCGGGQLTLLPTCPEVTGEAAQPFFRHLVGVGITDFVPATEVRDGISECRIQTVGFQLTSAMPYLYRPAVLVSDQVVVASGQDECAITTTDIWPGDATLKISVLAHEGDASDITITARPTFDDNCPPAHGGMPCFQYRITQLEMDSVFTIDGRSRSVDYYDPSLKDDRNGYPLLDPFVSDRINGDLFVWPDMAACTSLCICVQNNGPTDVTATIERYDREL
jgi:hypothetical protein